MTVITQHIKNNDFVSPFQLENNFIHSSILQKKEIAFETIKETNQPTQKSEYWKYTKLNKLFKSEFTSKPKQEYSFKTENNLNITSSETLNFIDGSAFSNNNTHLVSLNSNQEIQSEFFKLKNPICSYFDLLNQAYFSNGFSLQLNNNAEKPYIINYQFANQNLATFHRNIITAKKNTINKLIISSSPTQIKGFFNTVTEISLEENAHLEIVVIQNYGENYFNINDFNIKQEKESHFSIAIFSHNTGFLRNNINVDVAATNCMTHINGFYLSAKKEYIDNHTYINHADENCESHELFKGIAAGSSTIVFNGKVMVRQKAQKTNAFQSNKNILLTDDAQIYSKPELEIYADDVKCSHGSTTGELDEDALFYLKARGISDKTAKNMLVKAFANEVIETITTEELIPIIEQIIAEQFNDALQS
jgi:Fe-S cluster assembly protein SufD